MLSSPFDVAQHTGLQSCCSHVLTHCFHLLLRVESSILGLDLPRSVELLWLFNFRALERNVVEAVLETGAELRNVTSAS